jgi:uncharacterized protein YbaP (TraB family)
VGRMRHIFFAAIAFFLLPNLAAALCAGQDIRGALSPDEQSEMAQRIAQKPYAEGLYWKATRGGQELHVIGTIHIPDPRLDEFVERLRPVLSSANMLYVEAGPEEQAKLQSEIMRNPSLLFMTSGPTLPELLEPETWQALKKAAAARGFPGPIAAKAQPFYLSLLLAFPPCLWAEMNTGAVGLDGLLMKVAEQSELPIKALEPYDTLLTIMGESSIEEQIEMMELGVLPEDAIANSTASLVASYFEERPLEGFEMSLLLGRRYANVPPAEIDAVFDEMLTDLLDRRNKAWMAHLLAVPEGVTVAAFGAGHLSGENGILNLLAKEGFTLERQSLR